MSQITSTQETDQAVTEPTTDQQTTNPTHKQYVKNSDGDVFWPITAYDAIVGIDQHMDDFIDTVTKSVGKADGQGSLWFETPDNPSVGDLLYTKDANGYDVMEWWDGTEWVPIISTADLHKVQGEVDTQTSDIDSLVSSAAAIADLANSAVASAFDANAMASQASSAVADVQASAASAATSAQSAIADATNAIAQAQVAQSSAADAITASKAAQSSADAAIKSASGASTSVASLKQSVDSTAAIVSTLATQDSVDATNKTVTSLATETQQTAKELLNKADSTVVDDLKNTVTTQGVTVDQTAEYAKTLATQETVNTVSGKVDTLQAASDTTAAQIKNLVTKQELDATNGTVSNLSGEMDIANNKIADMVTQETVNTLTGAVNKNTGQINTLAGQVELKADSSTVTGLQTTINNFNTSSRNLIVNSMFAAITGWNWNGTQSAAADTTIVYNGNNSMRITATGGGNGSAGTVNTKFNGALTSGDKLTVTFYAKLISGTAQLHAEVNGSQGATNLTLTTDWKQYTVQLTYASVNTFYFWLTGAGEVVVNSPMLVAGTVAAKWNVAPEYLANAITTATEQVTKNTAAIDVNSKQLLLTASQTDLKTATTGMATQDYVAAQVKVASDSINNTVSAVKTDLGNLTAGDRNYILNSAILAPVAGNGKANQGTSTTTWGLFSFGAIQNAPFTDGQSLMLSVEYTVTGTPGGTFNPQFDETPWGYGADIETIKQSSGTYACGLKWKSAWAAASNAFSARGIQIRCDNVPVGTTITFTHISLKASSIKKDWTPAPEDGDTSSIGGQNLISGSDKDLVLDATGTPANNYKYDVVFKSLEAGKDYVFSSDVTVNAGSVTSITIGSFTSDLKNNLNLAAVPIINGHVSFSFTAKDTYTCLLVYAGLQTKTAGNKVTFHHYQLQIGTKETAWNLAQADQATVTALTSTNQTVDKLSGLVTDNAGKITSMQATVNGVQTTVTNSIKDVQTQQTTLADQWTSTVRGLGVPNLITNPNFDVKSDKTALAWTAFGSAGYVTSSVWDTYDGQGWAWNVTAANSDYHWMWFDTPVRDSGIYSGSIWVYPPTSYTDANNTLAMGIYFFDKAGTRLSFLETSPKQPVGNAGVLLKVENQKAPTGAVTVRFGFWLRGVGHTKFWAPMFNEGPVAGGYSNNSVNSAQIAEMQNDINLSVKEGNVVAQFNMDAGQTLIQNGKLVLDTPTVVFSGKAFIPSAAIINIDADLITTGKLNAANVDVINFNADNISTGTLKGINIEGANFIGDAMELQTSLTLTGANGRIYSNFDEQEHYNTEIYPRWYTGNIILGADGLSATGTAGELNTDDSRKAAKYQFSSFYGGDNVKLREYDPADKTKLVSRLDITGQRITMTDSATTNPNNEDYQNNGQWLDFQLYGIGASGQIICQDKDNKGNQIGQFNFVNQEIKVRKGSDIYFADSTDKAYAVLHTKSVSQTSLLSTKTDLQEIDPTDALNMVLATDIRSYQYQSDVGVTDKRYASLVIDDVNKDSQYSTPDMFLDQTHTGRDDGTLVGYLVQAIKALNRKVEDLENGRTSK